jgi:hypothetical protein
MHPGRPSELTEPLRARSTFSLPGVFVLSALFAVGAGLFAWLGRAPIALLVALGAVGVLAQLPGASTTYTCDDELLIRRRFWGRVQRFPRSALESIRGELGATVRVRFGALGTVHLDPRWPDQDALIARLHTWAPRVTPSAAELGAVAPSLRRVSIRALNGLPHDRCAVCGSRTGVAPRLVTAHHGLHLVLAGTMVRRGFELPTCRGHRWARQAAHGMCVVAFPVMFAASFVASAYASDAGLSRHAGLAIIVLPTLLFALLWSNDVVSYALDSLVLRVRLGWLSADMERATLHVRGAALRQRLLAHVGRARPTAGPTVTVDRDVHVP